MIKKLTLSVVLLTIFILSQNTANAGYFSDNSHIDDNMGFLKNTMNKNTSTEDVQEPVIAPAPKAKIAKIASKINPVATLTVQASAYTSTPDQTDSSPFITANGEHVYWGGVAANIIDTNGRNIPFGTKIMIPDLFGDQIGIERPDPGHGQGGGAVRDHRERGLPRPDRPGGAAARALRRSRGRTRAARRGRAPAPGRCSRRGSPATGTRAARRIAGR